MISISDGIISHIKANARNTYTAIPAIITDVSRLESHNQVSVQPAIQTILSNGTTFELPIIPEVPVQWPAGGGAVITFPIAVDDDVLLIFSMKSIAEWGASSGGTVEPFDQRMHNLSDAYVIPSIFRDTNNPIPSPDDFVIKFNDSEITIQKDGTILLDRDGVGTLKINPDGSHTNTCTETWSMTNGTGELIDLLTQCLQTISDTTVNTVYGVSPLNSKPAIDLLIDDLETFKE